MRYRRDHYLFFITKKRAKEVLNKYHNDYQGSCRILVNSKEYAVTTGQKIHACRYIEEADIPQLCWKIFSLRLIKLLSNQKRKMSPMNNVEDFTGIPPKKS